MIPHLEQQIAFLTACRDHGADRVEWRFRDPRDGFFSPGWKSASDIVPAWEAENEYEFRIRPRKHVIPKAEVPMPLKVKPENGSTYYVPDLCFVRNYSDEVWVDDDDDLRWLKAGLCYATPEDAAAAARAMLAREEE